jgi:GT2 family glycosyltransferase
MAVPRSTFEAVGGFDEGLRVWGGGDAEFSLRLWLLGFRCIVVPDVRVEHLFRRSWPYEIDKTMVVANYLRIAAVHFHGRTLSNAMAGLRRYRTAFPRATSILLASDFRARRRELRRLRSHDADWFLDMFGIDVFRDSAAGETTTQRASPD